MKKKEAIIHIKSVLGKIEEIKERVSGKQKLRNSLERKIDYLQLYKCDESLINLLIKEANQQWEDFNQIMEAMGRINEIKKAKKF